MPYDVIVPEKSHEDSVSLSVHWNKQNGIDQMPGWVQVTTERHILGRCSCDGIDTACNSRYCASRKKTDSSNQTSEPLPETVESEGPASIVTEVLTRDQINSLIRSLRRARDQAYGRDE